MISHNTDQKKTNADRVANFISSHRNALWIVLGVLIVLIVAFAIVQGNINSKNKYYSDTAAELQSDFTNWTSAPADTKDTLEKTFLDKVAGIVNSGKSNFLVDKALFLRGQLYLQKNEWASAYDDFNKVAEISPDSYLASVSLYNAASAKEGDGDLEGSLSLLQTLSEKYKLTSPLIPEALFSIGRLDEALGKNDEAVAAYENLSTSYTTSSWTNLAKTRIISLKASGVAK